MKYYEDLYNNEYRWSTAPNDIGKYVAEMYKYSYSHGWGRMILSKKITFSKRRLAKAWCLKHVRVAKARQEIVLAGRAQRKQARIDAKPKYSKLELKLQKAKKEIERLEANIKRADIKLKTLNTRRKTYVKKISSNLRHTIKLRELIIKKEMVK